MIIFFKFINRGTSDTRHPFLFFKIKFFVLLSHNDLRLNKGYQHLYYAVTANQT